MTDNDKDTTPRYTVNREKLEEYLKKVDEDVEWLNEFSKKIKESGN